MSGDQIVGSYGDVGSGFIKPRSSALYAPVLLPSHFWKGRLFSSSNFSKAAVLVSRIEEKHRSRRAARIHVEFVLGVGDARRDYGCVIMLRKFLVATVQHCLIPCIAAHARLQIVGD